MRSIPFAVCFLGMVNLTVADDSVDYLRQIKPVLQARCYACHGVLKQEAGLRLDTAAFAVKGGDSGKVISPGDASTSRLIERVRSGDESKRMPPEGEPLKQDEISALTAWIVAGAVVPVDEQPERNPLEHWAFQTPVRPTVPSVDWERDRTAVDPSHVPVVSRGESSRAEQNPIDSFIAATHQKMGLVPQPPTNKRAWLRRVSIDLIGLPPSVEESNAFVNDNSADAIDKVVTRLLDSPHYGERWGRHWMDIWRYSDWWGFGNEARNSHKHLWHWRDWIVESLNADKGYDQMLREMLAADELYPEDFDRLRAGGYLARQYFKFNRTSWLDETIEHTAKAMLGLTFNCAKCHDHKYDPFLQADYYRFRAIFEPYQVRIDAVDRQVDFDKDGISRPFDCHLDASTFIHIRGDDRNPDQTRIMEPALPAFLPNFHITVEPVSLPSLAVHPGLRSNVIEAYLDQAEKRVAETRADLEVARNRLIESERLESKSLDEKSQPPKDVPPADATAGNRPADSPPSVDQSRRELVIAEKALAWALLQPDLIRSRAAADRASLLQHSAVNAAELARAASHAERIAAVAKAEEDIARAELGVIRAAADKKAELETKLASNRTLLESAVKAVEETSESYTPIRGALKSFESSLETEELRQKPFPVTSTGRRTALAKWITDARHPLTARVAVNHIWLRHFGQPLVPTVFDFGRKGAPPTQPDLLDWLAVELMEGGRGKGDKSPWGMKHIHRLIVTSKSYQMSSSAAGAASQNLRLDPDNRFHWRMNPIRMEAQIVRDSLLHLSRELDPTMGGPSIPVADEASRRRSIYYVHSNSDHQKFLAMFDDASVLDCYRRAESIVPQQALALENSSLATEMAEKIASQIEGANPGSNNLDFSRMAYLSVLSVEPSESELVTMVEFLMRLEEASKQANRTNPMLHARTGVVLALLNHNDFVTVR